MTKAFKLNPKAMQTILTSAAVRKDLEARARRIAAAAGSGMVVDSQVGRKRARASVRTATRRAQYREARSRALTIAIAQGRG